MQKLFILSFVLLVASALFVGHAFSAGHVPYMGLVACAVFFLALFLPFLSEYNLLHRGFFSIGNNFKSLMHSREEVKGEVEILTPSQMQSEPKTHHLDEGASVKTGLFLIVIIGAGLLLADTVGFYILGEGLKGQNGPISNF